MADAHQLSFYQLVIVVVLVLMLKILINRRLSEAVSLMSQQKKLDPVEAEKAPGRDAITDFSCKYY